MTSRTIRNARGETGENRFLRACWRKPVDRTPIWLMRQAGRYLPGYRKVRKDHSLLTICKNPKLAAAITLLPVEKLGVDAAIIFADIMLPLQPMGISFTIQDEIGPVISKPVSTFSDVDSLLKIDPVRDLPHVLEAIRLVKAELPEEIPLIGFCGAPFTLASYIIEGKPSRDLVRTRTIMYDKPEVWKGLMSRLTQAMGSYLKAQVHAGAQAIQIFDSWIGCLSPTDYREYVEPYSSQLFATIAEESVPSIHFGTGTGLLLEDMKRAGGDIIGLDWRIPIGDAWSRLGDDVGIQGNLDPVVLLTSYHIIRSKTEQILSDVNGRPGHIFNLGHGVLPNTPVENVSQLVNLVHELSVPRSL